MRMSTFKTAFRKFFTAFFLATALAMAGTAQVGITPATAPGASQPGDIVSVDFLVYNFNEIVSMQYTMQWDVSKMTFLNGSNYNLPSLSNANFGMSQANNGILGFSWIDQSTIGLNLADCATIYRLNFQLTGTEIPTLVVNGSYTPVEITNAIGQTVTLIPGLGCAGAGYITGKVFLDNNNDCLFDLNDTPGANRIIKITGGGFTFFSSTNPDGTYLLYLPNGTYQVEAVSPSPGIWEACQPAISVEIIDNESVTVDFPMQPLAACPVMQVDIAAPFLRRCMPSTYHINYCNNGTETAPGASVEVTFDPFLTVQGSSIPWTSVDGNTYTFPIGDVAALECGSFSVQVEVGCDAALGQTHCSEALVFPNEYCGPVDPLWDGSDLEVTGNCDADSVRFQVENVGDDMSDPAEFIVIEDDMIMFEGQQPLLLNSQETFHFTVPANGSTWRLELDESPFNPLDQIAAAVVEGCVTGSNGFTTGFVTMFPLSQNSVKDIDCQANIGSYDPNDKIGYPNGACAAHYIEPNQDIEYRIRFQNTGTDTAFTVVVKDTLPLSLDPAGLVLGASSHPFDFDLSGDGVATFTFNNILLPDSTTNEQASHGFVRFSIPQKPDNQIGTIIENTAAIYFDFNDPVATNTYRHTVAEDFLGNTGGNGNLSISGVVQAWNGGAVEGATVSITPGCQNWTDADGQFAFPGLDSLTSYHVFAQKQNLDQQKGVTILDLIFMRNAILALAPFSSAYQNIAGDVNNSGGITTFDMVVARKMAVGIPENGPGAGLWTFIPADFVFPGPNLTSYPSMIVVDSLSADLTDADFVGMKPGDVISEDMVEVSSISPLFYLVPTPAQGDFVNIEVRTVGFEKVNGFQFGLRWNPDEMEWASSEYVDPAFGQNIFNLQEAGEMPILAYDGSPNGVTLPDSTLLFTIKFALLQPDSSAFSITHDEAVMPLQVVVETDKLANGKLEGTVVHGGGATLIFETQGNDLELGLSPNPVESGRTIYCEVETGTPGTVKLELFDPAGRRIFQKAQLLSAGPNRFPLTNCLVQGIYLLHITDENGRRGVAKMVVR